jgi:hypothetical protein
MNKKVLCAFGALALTMSMVVGCGGGSSGSGSGGSTATGGATGSGGSTGIGGSKGSGGSGAGGASAVQTACRALCESEGTHNCHTATGTSTEDCMSYRCPAAGEANSKEGCPAACKSAWMAYWACLVKQENAMTPNPETPSKPGCQEPGSCTAEAAAICPGEMCE